MQIQLKDNLPFTSVTVSYRGADILIPDILIDTGSGSTILSASAVRAISITPSPEDTLYTIRGVGGNEVVFSRKVDFFRVGDQSISDFEVEIGAMDYGFDIKGILDMDFLNRAGAIINLQNLHLEFVQ